MWESVVVGDYGSVARAQTAPVRDVYISIVLFL